MALNFGNFETQKKEIELSLARTLLTKCNKEQITFKQMQEIAGYIRLYIDDIRSARQMVSFLKDLSSQWDIFKTLYEFYKLHQGEKNRYHKFAVTAQF